MRWFGLGLFLAMAPAVDAVTPDTLEEELKELSSMLEIEFPEIIGASDLEVARIFRDAIHEKVPLGPALAYNYNSPILVYVQTFHGRNPMICGGYSILFRYMLEARGIDTRRVGMFAEKDENNGRLDSHVSVDVRIGDDWVAMDPTFNVGFWDEDGAPLAWDEVRSIYLSGNEPVVLEGPTMPEGQAELDTYYIGLDELTRYMSISGGEPEEPIYRNLGWDGILTYKDGQKRDYPITFTSVVDRYIAEN